MSEEMRETMHEIAITDPFAAYALIREMRDSLRDVTDLLEAALMTSGNPQPGSIGGVAKRLIAKADAILKESGEPVKYGCHCDLDEGTAPNDCVMDHGTVAGCTLAQRLVRGQKTKHDCEHWKPIK